MLRKSLTAAAFCVGLLGQQAHAETFELTLAGFVSPQHGMSKWLDDWAVQLEEDSGGRIQFETLHGAQMGPPPRYYDLARNGQADVTWVLHGATPGRFPLAEISNMPFMFCSAEQATRVINDPRLRETFIDPEHRGVKVLLQFATPPGQAMMTGDAVLDVDGFSGKALRPASAAIGQLIAQVGGTPVGLPPTAVAEALQKGTIDGTFVDYGGAAFGFQLGPFLQNITEVDFYVTSFVLAMNPDTFDSMPEDLQQIVTDSIQGIEMPVSAIFDNLDEAGRAALMEQGVTINAMPDEQLAQLRDIGAQVTQKYVDDLDAQGLAGTETLNLMREITQEVGEVGFGCL